MTDQEKYQIQAQGRISERWADWFADMTITVSDEDDAPAITTLTGTVADQAALLGAAHCAFKRL